MSESESLPSSFQATSGSGWEQEMSESPVSPLAQSPSLEAALLSLARTPSPGPYDAGAVVAITASYQRFGLSQPC